MTDADKIKELTQKLKQQGDISLEEADEIYFFSLQKLPGLSPTLIDWYSAVSDEIKKGRRGNFIFTIDLSKDANYLWLIKRDIQEYGTFEDLCRIIMIDKRLCPPIKGSPSKSYYEITTSRAGMLNYPIETDAGACTLSQLIAEKFSPVMEKRGRTTGEILFEVASGALEIFPHSRFLKEITGTMAAKCVVVSYMKYKDVPCMTITGCKDKDGEFSVFFTEKDKAQIIKDVLKIPFEDIVKNALDEDVIDKQMAKDLLNCKLISNFPAESFMKTSVEFVDKRLQMQKERKATEKAVEEEDGWLMEVR